MRRQPEVRTRTPHHSIHWPWARRGVDYRTVTSTGVFVEARTRVADELFPITYVSSSASTLGGCMRIGLLARGLVTYKYRAGDISNLPRARTSSLR